MIKGDGSLQIIGIQHIATKNNVTVRARIFLSDLKGNIYSFDADILTFELDTYSEVKQNMYGIWSMPE